MTLRYRDIKLPNNEYRLKVLTDRGHIVDGQTMSHGERAYVLIAKTIVEHGWRLDDSGKQSLARLLQEA